MFFTWLFCANIMFWEEQILVVCGILELCPIYHLRTSFQNLVAFLYNSRILLDMTFWRNGAAHFQFVSHFGRCFSKIPPSQRPFVTNDSYSTIPTVVSRFSSNLRLTLNFDFWISLSQHDLLLFSNEKTLCVINLQLCKVWFLHGLSA